MAKRQQQVVDIESKRVEETALAERPKGAALVGGYDYSQSLANTAANLKAIEQFVKESFVEGIDYGPPFPGGDKPTLLQPGADKFDLLFNVYPDYEALKEVEDPETGFAMYRYRCLLRNRSTDQVISSGIGSCNSYETKYRYRTAERTCPNCHQATIFRSKNEDDSGDRGWFCWIKKGGCGANFSSRNPEIIQQEVGRVENPNLCDTWNCVTPETRILTRDLRWVPAGEIVTGDVLISVAEEAPDTWGRPYREAVATVYGRFTDELYEVRLEDGRTVQCNGEHRWLSKLHANKIRWITTRQIYEEINTVNRRGRPRTWRIMTMHRPWQTDKSFDAGYLAGLLDADGSLDVARGARSKTPRRYNGAVVSFAQQLGGVLDRLRASFTERGFLLSEYAHLNPRMRAPVVKMVVRGGFFEQMRALGTIRPLRLLDRWANLVDLKRRRFEGTPLLVESVTRTGQGELVRLGTSSHTYIAEGMVCHNTVDKIAQKRARVAAVISTGGVSARFTQDADDLPDDDATPKAAKPAQSGKSAEVKKPEPKTETKSAVETECADLRREIKSILTSLREEGYNDGQKDAAAYAKKHKLGDIQTLGDVKDPKHLNALKELFAGKLASLTAKKDETDGEDVPLSAKKTIDAPHKALVLLLEKLRENGMYKTNGQYLRRVSEILGVAGTADEITDILQVHKSAIGKIQNVLSKELPKGAK